MSNCCSSVIGLFLHIEIITYWRVYFYKTIAMNIFRYNFVHKRTLFSFLNFVFFMFLFSIGKAQFLQIESILVDACDNTVEGKNEMVSFIVESSPINVADIRVDGSINGGAFQTNKWPNTSNSFLGWAVPGSAAHSDAVSKVAQINASIVNCGKLIMPTGGTSNLGVIPAGKKGLIITSTEFSPFAHDFSTLTDTIYVIFQKPGNTAGHFANYSTGSGQRALRLHKISTGISEVVSYDKSNLVDQNGVNIAQDGAGVRFTPSGVASYYNDGCQAPYIPLIPNWTPPAAMCPTSPSVNLSSLVTGTSGGTWSGTGVNGATFNPTGLNGTYSVTYTLGIPPCQVSQSHNISVVPSSFATWTPPAALCQSSPSINLNTLLDGAATPGGVWSGNGVSGNVFNPSGLNGNINVTYTVGSSPCIATETHVIQVVNAATATWIPPSALCQSSASIILDSLLSPTATTGGVWSGNGVSGNVFNPSGLNGGISITYSVGSAPCNASESHIIQVISSANASWTAPSVLCQSSPSINLNTLLEGAATPGGSWSGTGVTGNTFNPNGLNGSYDVTYTVGSAPCIAIETHPIQVMLSANATWVSPNAICESASSINLNSLLTSIATTGGSWTGLGVVGNIFNPAGLSGNISVTYSVGTPPCQASQTQIIEILPSMDASWTPPTSICEDANPIDLSQLVIDNSEGVWSGQGVSFAIFNPTGLSGDVLVSYIVTGVNACPDTVTHSIYVVPIPDASWFAPSVICKNEGAFNLDDLIIGTVGGSWSGDGIDSNILDFNSVGDSLLLTYFVDDSGCSSSKTQMVYFSEVKADFTISPDNGFAPLEAFTTNLSSNAISYRWNFGNGNFSTDVNPSTVYLMEGTYYVWLTATSAKACVDSTFRVVIINETEDFIPNAITINGDGINEEFYPVITKVVDKYRMMIYNRWGEMIYSTNNQYDKWDGTYRGKKVAQGVYFYVITYQYNQINPYYNGTVTVIE